MLTHRFLCSTGRSAPWRFSFFFFFFKNLTDILPIFVNSLNFPNIVACLHTHTQVWELQEELCFGLFFWLVEGAQWEGDVFYMFKTICRMVINEDKCSLFYSVWKRERASVCVCLRVSAYVCVYTYTQGRRGQRGHRAAGPLLSLPQIVRANCFVCLFVFIKWTCWNMQWMDLI